MSQGDLFGGSASSPSKPAMAVKHPVEQSRKTSPLAARMRPSTLEDYVGQEHIMAPGKLLRRSIEADRIQSLILYGPPGTGKTTLAQIIAHHTQSHFERLSGVESNVAEMRRTLATATQRLAATGQSTLLFVDEIHRFNKSQQDVLLPDVESGVIQLIGATTHNPFFFVNAPLVSRSQIFELRPLDAECLKRLLKRALEDEERGLGTLPLKVAPAALDHLAHIADGDARKALNALEIAATTTDPHEDGHIHISLEVMEACIQKKAVVYDGDGDAHYDTISAFIKSMRGGDPDAALYWLAKRIHAGEDPRFITRRIMICAAEDVGLADPMALVLAQAAHQTVEVIGWPEARIPIAEAVIYISGAPRVTVLRKPSTCRRMSSLVRPCPFRCIRRWSPAGPKNPDTARATVTPMTFLLCVSDCLKRKTYYEPTEQGVERKLKERILTWREAFRSQKPSVKHPSPSPPH